MSFRSQKVIVCFWGYRLFLGLSFGYAAYRTILISVAAIIETSSLVLFFPREMRIVPSARDLSKFMADSTCETWVRLLSQAEPVEIQIPFRSIL